jgi:hypothetical protein
MLADAADELTVDVWLTATAHFSISTPTSRPIMIKRRQVKSDAATFTVTVVDPPPGGSDPPTLQALFAHRMRTSGFVRRELTIQSGNGTLGDAETGRASSGSVGIVANAPLVDLAITVTRIAGSGTSYTVKVATEFLGGVGRTGRWELDADSEDYVRSQLASFVDDAASSRERTAALAGAGLTFFTSAPAVFRELYWELVDTGTPPRSISVTSDERWVPWELMIPSRQRDGVWQRREPLGVECSVGRWHHTEYTMPSLQIPLQDSLVLAPEYKPPKVLPKSAAERDMVLRIFPGKVVPSHFDDLDDFYRHHSASLLHFVCHGKDDTLQEIALLDKQYLSAQEALGGGVAESCRRSRPLVFLNACELGRPGAGLVNAGGFPAAFIESGVAGLIAPLWKVDDEVAHEVATTFYETVQRDPTMPFAEILRKLRARGYGDDGEDSFAAYCYYGDPMAAAAAIT